MLHAADATAASGQFLSLAPLTSAYDVRFPRNLRRQLSTHCGHWEPVKSYRVDPRSQPCVSPPPLATSIIGFIAAIAFGLLLLTSLMSLVMPQSEWAGILVGSLLLAIFGLTFVASFSRGAAKLSSQLSTQSCRDSFRPFLPQTGSGRFDPLQTLMRSAPHHRDYQDPTLNVTRLRRKNREMSTFRAAVEYA